MATQLVLPVAVIVLFDSGYVISMIRASMIEVMQRPYIRTAVLKGMPFRDAHHVTGRIVAKAASEDVPLHGLTLDQMRTIEPRVTKDVFAVLSVENSVKSRVSYGGTAPKNVRREANRWLKALGPKTAKKAAKKGG